MWRRAGKRACFHTTFCDLFRNKDFRATFKKFHGNFFKTQQSCVGVQQGPYGLSER